MKKLLFLLCILICTIFSSAVKAAEILDARSVSANTRDGLNIINFSVQVDIAKDYFAQFWLLPARHADNSFTSYQVFVNEKKVGDIIPSKGNWQSIGIKGNPALPLREGSNIISIATTAPELPQIEDVKVVSAKSIEAFPSREYRAFCEKAGKRTRYNVPQFSYFNSGIQKDTKDFYDAGIEIGEVNLVYSFFSVFSFVKGQQIFITTSSDEAHDFDLVYHGCEEFIIVPVTGDIPADGIQSGDDVIGDVVADSTYSPIAKPNYTGRPATSLEMQGLNWKAISDTVLSGQNTSRQVASLLLDIPKEGRYLLRVRTRDNGHTGVADVNVNGLYYYSNMPISYTMLNNKLNGQVPGDVMNWESGTYAEAHNGNDNPFLFIQGSDADRVVGYSDSCTPIVQKKYGLKTNDSFIQQDYQVDTSAVSVLNYRSRQPEGKCTVVSQISILPGAVSMESTDYDINGNNQTTIHGDLTLHDPIRFEDQMDSVRITAFDFSANQLRSVFISVH